MNGAQIGQTAKQYEAPMGGLVASGSPAPATLVSVLEGVNVLNQMLSGLGASAGRIGSAIAGQSDPAVPTSSQKDSTSPTIVDALERRLEEARSQVLMISERLLQVERRIG